MEIKNNKIQPKDKKLTKINKKGQNNNKHLFDYEERKADDNSKSFPNFSVLTPEERLVFFQALSTARKNIEKKGNPARERFGTVHDEYLKYFDQNVEDKQEEVRFTKSDLTLCDDGNHFCSDPFSVKIDQRNLKEKKCRSPTLRNIKKTPRESSTPVPFARRSRRQQNSGVQLDTNALVDVFLKKNKRNETELTNLSDIKTKSEKSFKTCEALNEKLEQNMRKKKLFMKPFREGVETPRFNILSAKEKEIFFKIFQKARDNIIEKNPYKQCDILPLDDIMRRYQGASGVTTFFTTTEDNMGREGKKRNLRVTVTVTSKDNERLLLKQSQMLPDNVEERTKEIYTIHKNGDLRARGLKPKKLNTSEDKKDVKFCQSEEVIEKTKRNSSKTIVVGNEEMEKENFKGIMTLKTTQEKTDENKEKLILENPGKPRFLTQKTCECKSDSPEISYSDTEINSYKNLSATKEKNLLKKSEIPKSSLAVKVVSDPIALSRENNDILRKEENVSSSKKNSIKEKKIDRWSLPKDKEKSKKMAQRYLNFIDRSSKKGCEKNDSAENINELKVEECVRNPMAVEKEEFEVIPSEEMSSSSQNFQTKGLEDLKEEDDKSIKREGIQKSKEENKNTSEMSMSQEILKEISGPKMRGFPINRVMLVNDDVIIKLKHLICYLEAKTNKDDHLEKKYLTLLMDYALYLSKVLEFLALRKEKQHRQEKKALVATDALFHDEDSFKELEENPESEKSSISSISNEDFKIRRPSVTLTMKSEQNAFEVRKSDLTGQSNSKSISESEKKTHKKNGRKIRLFQDLVRQRAELVEGSFEDFEIVCDPEKASIPQEKPASVHLSEEEYKKKAQQESKINILKALVKWCGCQKKV